ncbi:Ionotropic receptor, partial [Operophtera brumata]
MVYQPVQDKLKSYGVVEDHRKSNVLSLRRNNLKKSTMSIFTQDRMKVEDYIAMVGSTAVRFVFREPPLAYMSNIFALPFTWSVWLAIFICVLGCALFLFITSKWEASMTMQGCTLEPRYAAAMTILYAAYSANIVVLLRAPSSSVRSLPDLLNSPLKLGANPLRKTIYDKKIAPKGKKPNFYTMEVGVEKLRQGLFAFHMELNPGYRLIQETFQEDEKCDLVEIDYINEIDPWIRETGIQSCLHRRMYVPKPKCSGQVSTFSSVGITDMYPALLATLYGFLLAPAMLDESAAEKGEVDAQQRSFFTANFFRLKLNMYSENTITRSREEPNHILIATPLGVSHCNQKKCTGFPQAKPKGWSNGGV